MLKGIPMLHLFHASFVTASLQLVAIVIATVSVLLFAPRDINCSAAPPMAKACEISWSLLPHF
jgi:hypothetical protein